MWDDFWTALALMLVIEGIMPFINPAGLRRTLRAVMEMDDTLLRAVGFFSMALGVVLLYLVH